MTSTADRPIAILSAPGSRGDVNPMVAIGAQLRRNGFDVVISLAENYAHVAEAAGLIVEPVISRADFDGMINDPSVWKPFSGARAILRDAVGRFIEPHLQVIAKHHRPQRTILVSHPLDFASRIHRDLDPTTPLVGIHLSPVMIRSFTDPPRLSPWWFEPRRPPWLMKLGYAIVDYTIADRFLSPSVNGTRKRLGLPRVSRIFDRWWLSPDLVLGMYPDWFGNQRANNSGDWKACGFPIIRDGSEASPADNSGKNLPIFFTPGTAHKHAQAFFLNAIAACDLIGKPCILATAYPEQLPLKLPNHVTSTGYTPLDPLLRSCAAIVHHGGIGTTSMALATGCPQLVCPLAFDQFHNADQVVRLGTGTIAAGNPWNHSPEEVRKLSTALRSLIDATHTRQQCADLAAKQDSFAGAETAAIAIKQRLLLREVDDLVW